MTLHIIPKYALYKTCEGKVRLLRSAFGAIEMTHKLLRAVGKADLAIPVAYVTPNMQVKTNGKGGKKDA